jgi:hypothetical protein
MTGRNLKNTRDAFASVDAAKDEIRSELQTELSGLKQRNQFTPETHNALDRALSARCYEEGLREHLR